MKSRENKNLSKKEPIMKEVIDDNVGEKIEEQEKEVSLVHLIVQSPFGNYGKGDLIKDKEEVDLILSGHEKCMVSKLLRNK